MHQKEFRSQHQLTPFFYILRPYPHPAMKAYLPSSRGRFRKTELAISKSCKGEIVKRSFRFNFFTYQPIAMRHGVKSIKMKTSRLFSAQNPQSVFFVSLGQATQHYNFVESTYAQMTGVHCSVPILVKMSERCWRSHIKIWTHKRSCIWCDLHREYEFSVSRTTCFEISKKIAIFTY